MSCIYIVEGSDEHTIPIEEEVILESQTRYGEPERGE
jgi:hypothetical protein